MDEEDSGWSFRYDPLERLTFASVAHQCYHWFYNAIGDSDPIDTNNLTGVRWDQNDNDFFTLSEDGLSISGVTKADAMLATHGVRTGKWYLAEVTFSGPAPRVGVADLAFLQSVPYLGYPGGTGASIGYLPETGSLRKKDGLGYKDDRYASADAGILSLLLDLDEDEFIVWLDGEELGRQTVESGLTWYPALSKTPATFELSTNFGSRPFQYTVPAGYFSGINTSHRLLFDKNEEPLPFEPDALCFDAHGNLLEDGSNTYRYNDAGRMQQSINAEGLVTDYSYNVFEQRIKKVNSKENLHYVYYPDGLLMMEADADGTPLVEYLCQLPLN